MQSEKKMEESSREMVDDYSSDESESWDEGEMKDQPRLSLAYKMKCVKMAKAHPDWNLKTLQRHGCSRLKDIELLPQWEAECKNGRESEKYNEMNCIDKYRMISEWTLENIVRARKRKLPVKVRHIRQWALAVAAQFPDLRFAASRYWLGRFRQKYRNQLRETPSSPDSKLAQ